MVKLTPTGVKINTNLVWTSHNTGGVEFNTGVFAVQYPLFWGSFVFQKAIRAIWCILFATIILKIHLFVSDKNSIIRNVFFFFFFYHGRPKKISLFFPC